MEDQIVHGLDGTVVCWNTVGLSPQVVGDVGFPLAASNTTHSFPLLLHVLPLSFNCVGIHTSDGIHVVGGMVDRSVLEKMKQCSYHNITRKVVLNCIANMTFTDLRKEKGFGKEDRKKKLPCKEG